MPKATTKGKGKHLNIPQAGVKGKKDLGKFNNGVKTGLTQKNQNKILAHNPHAPPPLSLTTLAPTSTTPFNDLLPHNAEASSSNNFSTYVPQEFVDASLRVRDNSSKAFLRELRKVIERSDIIIQVLDARDPLGTRSPWVEEEVRKRDGQGKKLIAVLNKCDLIPLPNLLLWLRHLRHYFPTLPFKSSLQSQRQNLSQTPLSLPTSTTSSSGHASLPSTSSSLGAPELLHLLKQYSLSRPHQTLTVGIIGYPNVGKSSLINSLKRSRACGVAAMPGKTRVVQEVVLDKGVKVLDCPGVVLEDFSAVVGGEAGETERRRRMGEVMLRNCLKVEEIEDPIAPVEVILERVEGEVLQKIYNIPAFKNVTEFLVTIALTRGRLGKGGVPDLEGSATMVLRDWNAGKIPYHSTPPLIHPSTLPSSDKTIRATGPAAAGGMDVDDETGDAGDAILGELGQGFDLEGLFSMSGLGEGGGWEGQGEGEGLEDVAGGVEEFQEEEEDFNPFPSSSAAAPVPHPHQYNPHLNPLPSNPTHLASTSRLFTPDELSLLPSASSNPLDRKLLRQQAKKRAKSAREHAEATLDLEGLMLGNLGGEEDEEKAGRERERARKAKKEKKGKKVVEKKEKGTVLPVVGDEELEFQAFLNQMGADVEDDDEAMDM